MRLTPRAATAAAMFLFSFGLVLFELVLTRLFGVVLFATFAHLALALALLGISLGALLQHLWPALVPEEGLQVRLGWLSLLMAATTIAAVWFTVAAPITLQFDAPPETFSERSMVSWELVSPLWFGLLMPVLAVPFGVAGLAFAGTFQRRKADIGLLYGLDLMGGAAAAVAFVPLLSWLPAPDVAFVVALAGCGGAAVLFFAGGARRLAAAAALPAAVCAVLVGLAASGTEVLRIRFAAGYSEERITTTRWTPLTRLAVHEGNRGHFVVLDNTSASEVVRSKRRREQLSREPNRGLVYQLVPPTARVAILAASAGPEVAVAQSFGFTDIQAIDIAPEIGDLVAERYASNPYNPYLQPGTERVVMDGRAAILHSPHDFDVIQMVHANLHSSAGQLANAWSPALLETQEAFDLYLSRLSPDGVLSFGRGSKTRHLVSAAAAALHDRGVENPQAHILWVAGAASVMLVRNRPWTSAEVQHARTIIAQAGAAQHIEFDPTVPDHGVWRRVRGRRVQVDDRPYLESPDAALNALGVAFGRLIRRHDGKVSPVTVVYHTLALQIVFVGAIGVLLLVLPLWRRATSGLAGIPGARWGLAYMACLGYGYLAIETVLLHELVLFVGHPTYAITIVILAMLLFSGLGSIVVGRLPQDQCRRALTAALLAVIGLGALQAWVVPEVFYAFAFGLPLGVRAFLVLLALAPLGFVMGMPFPLALRILRPSAAGLVPWAWALNGYTSVVASLGTVLLSRLSGYDVAFGVALAAYGTALALSHRIHRVGSDIVHS